MTHTAWRIMTAYLWVDEWARVEELWDLEEAWLAGNDRSVAGRMTRSVAGTFFDMYCKIRIKRLRNVKERKLLIRYVYILIKTYIHHRDFLRAGSWVIRSVSKVTIGMFRTHVLSHMIVHLLSLFPVERFWEIFLLMLSLQFNKRTRINYA